jgi:hypothetical protein
MSLSAHIESLENKHNELKAQVAAESARPSPDFAKVTQMKKQKLRIKEELQRLQQETEAA